MSDSGVYITNVSTCLYATGVRLVLTCNWMGHALQTPCMDALLTYLGQYGGVVQGKVLHIIARVLSLVDDARGWIYWSSTLSSPPAGEGLPGRLQGQGQKDQHH